MLPATGLDLPSEAPEFNPFIPFSNFLDISIPFWISFLDPLTYLIPLMVSHLFGDSDPTPNSVGCLWLQFLPYLHSPLSLTRQTLQ